MAHSKAAQPGAEEGHVEVLQHTPPPQRPDEHSPFTVQAEPVATWMNVQTPAVHTCVPGVQMFPQLPQLAVSVCRFEQTGPFDPEHVVWPVEHETPQTPLAQTWPLAQWVPHAPQLFVSLCRLEQ